MSLDLLCFVGFVKDNAALQKLIESYNEDFDQNPFTKLMKLKHIDSDFTDYEHFGAPMTLAELAAAAKSIRIESGKNRFSAEISQTISPALESDRERVDGVNALVVCSNEYEPWELTAFKKFSKGKTWFMFVTDKPDDWGKPKGTKRPIFFVQPEAFYRQWAEAQKLPYSAELRVEMVIAQIFHHLGEDRFFDAMLNSGNVDKNDSFDTSSILISHSLTRDDVFRPCKAQFNDPSSMQGKLLASLGGPKQ